MMEAYREQIKKRRVRQVALTLVATALMVTATFIPYWGVIAGAEDGTFLEGFNAGVSLGLMAAFVLLSVVQIVQYSRALKSDEALRQMQIKEEDEREKLIRDKIGGFGFNLTLGVVLVATVVFTWVNTLVAFTLFCVLAVMTLMKAGLKAYYSRRY